MKTALSNFNEAELSEILKTFGEPSYRAKQLFKWVHQATPFDKMSNLPKSLTAKLSEDYVVTGVSIFKKLVSRDGTVKYLFALDDGNIVEGVLMRYKYGNTLCVSTQIGCRMNCAFCASGIDGLIRNLTAGEILGEILEVNRDEGATADKRAVTNVVLMGSGEPLDNYDNVLRFIRLVTAPEGDGISQRHITLSTCGIVPKIYELADENLSVNLAVSLHSSSDEARSRIMPVNKKYKLETLMKACRDYTGKTGRRITFEYAVIENVNSSREDAVRLAGLMKGMISHINLIGVNNVKERDYYSSAGHVEKFKNELLRLGINATVRRKLGADIDAACGQLRREFESSRGDMVENSK